MLIGRIADTPEIQLSRLDLLAGIHAEDRIRIDSVQHEAVDTGRPFETECRTEPRHRGTRWLRLVGRAERLQHGGSPRLHGLAFDLIESRNPTGSPSQRAHRQ